MNARVKNFRKVGYDLGQFPLQSVLEIALVSDICPAELILINDIVADAGAPYQTFSCDFKAQLVDLVFRSRNQDGSSLH